MEQFSEFIPIFGFLLSLCLFGYGLKKVLLKVEDDKFRQQEKIKGNKNYIKINIIKLQILKKINLMGSLRNNKIKYKIRFISKLN